MANETSDYQIGKLTGVIESQGAAISSIEKTIVNLGKDNQAHHEELMAKALSCPESSHIKEQNSKIDKIKTTVNSMSTLMGIWKWVLSIILPIIIGMLISIIMRETTVEVKPKDVKASVMELREEILKQKK